MAFHWYFDEEARLLDDRPWEIRAEELADVPLRALLGRGARTALVLVLGLVVAMVLQRLQPTEMAQAREEMAALLQAEAQAWLDRDWQDAQEMLDPEAHPDWIRWHLRSLEARRNWAREDARLPVLQVTEVRAVGLQRVWATVVYSQLEVPQDYPMQEGVVFRRVEGSWRRSAPGNAGWGPLHLKRVGPLYWEYREEDAAGVARLAPAIPAAYGKMRTALGLPPEDPAAPLTVRIVVDPALVRPPIFVGRQLTLLSPHLARRRAADSPAQALSRPLMVGLAERATEEALGGRGLDPRWGVLYRGVQRWLARHFNPLLPPDDAPDWAPLRRELAERGIPDLAQLHERRYGGYFWRSRWADLAAEALVRHALEQYGPERVSRLLVGMAESEDWESLSLRVFGVPAQELEAGWQAMLEDLVGNPSAGE